MSRPGVCFCSIAFRDQPLREIMPRLAEAGYDGVEVFHPQVENEDDAGLDAIRALAGRHRIALPVVSPYFWLTRDLPELIERSYRTAERCVAIARRLGASRIRTFVDAGMDGIGSAEATPEQWDRAVRELKRITALAPDLLFVVETHVHTLADTPESTLRLLERVAAPNLAVNFQPGDWDPVAGYRLLRHAVRHCHLQNPRGSGREGYLEEGPSAWPDLLAELRRDGYAGTLSVEYCWQGVAWPRAASARVWLRGHGF